MRGSAEILKQIGAICCPYLTRMCLQAERILAQSKANDNAAFAEAQRTGKETVGAGADKVASGEAAPAISQVDSFQEEEPDVYADRVAQRAEVSGIRERMQV